jgi:hypothetical protein
MVFYAISKNNVSIRLSEERWAHILIGHAELAEHQNKILEAISSPEKIYDGNEGELLAIITFDEKRKLVTVYKENNKDGFVITAFITSKLHKLEKLKQLWP